MKKINTDPHSFISIIAPAGCGKTILVAQIILNQKIIFRPCFEKILYFHTQFQFDCESPLLGCTQEKLPIEFHQGFQWIAVDRSDAEKLRTLVVIDDLYQDACEDGMFLNLVVAERHRNIHLMTLRHNIYQPTKNSKTIDLKVTQMILFKSPRDVEQIGVLGRQLGDTKILLEAYKRSTREPFGHLLIDLEPETDQKLEHCSNCSSSPPSVFLSLYNSNKRDFE